MTKLPKSKLFRPGYLFKLGHPGVAHALFHAYIMTMLVYWVYALEVTAIPF
jgi:hypothetical protein